MYTLDLAPLRAGYSGSGGAEVVATKLDGGASRQRRDIIGSASMVSCSWLFNVSEYQYFQAFFKTVTVSGSLPFLIDLILDNPYSESYEARFVPNSVKLTAKQGVLMAVSASLEVKPVVARNADLDLAIVELWAAFGSDYATYLDLLNQLVNVDLPDSLGV